MPPLEELPRIDEHTVVVSASPQLVWEAVLASLERSFAAPGSRLLARLLGTDPVRTSGWERRAVGSAIPGFRIEAALPPRLLVIAGRHRFSRYGIVFRIEAGADGTTRCGAESRAAFPGVHGRLYRLAVVGSGGHVVVVRRMLRGIRRLAERRAADLASRAKT